MRTIVLLSGLLCFSAIACARPAPRPGPGAPAKGARKEAAAQKGRVPVVKPGDPLYERVEGASFKNDCRDDAACHVGGCSGEVCSAEEGVITTCEVRDFPQRKVASTCGCVAGKCVWYSTQGRDPGGKDKGGGKGQPGGQGQGSTAPGMGAPCPDGRCGEGLRCLSYYGFAGPAGPKFTSCEIPCTGGKGCPKGTSCVSISDGPGQVCRGAEGGTQVPPAGSAPLY